MWAALKPPRPREFLRLSAICIVSVVLFCIPAVRATLGVSAWLLPYTVSKPNLGPKGYGFFLDNYLKFMIIMCLNAGVSLLGVYAALSTGEGAAAIVINVLLLGVWIFLIVLLSNAEITWYGACVSGAVFMYQALWQPYVRK